MKSIESKELIMAIEELEKEREKTEETQKILLQEQTLKIKNSLSRCGNTILTIKTKEQLRNILLNYLWIGGNNENKK